ncbi:MAG: hypothetical protein ACOYKJ_02420 [Candidatus Howiella sp.]|jgi:hypothetical protein
MGVTVQLIDAYENFGRCVKISNGAVEALVTVDVGPRVIRLCRPGGVNVMFNDLERAHFNNGPHYDKYYYKGAQWNIYGGHRLWIAPESAPETAYPDNNPVAYSVTPSGAVFTQPPQVENGVAFEIELEMEADAPALRVIHRVTNIGKEEKTFAVWALSVLAPGGVEIIPQNTQDTGLLPNRTVAMWPYCDFSDDRLHLGHSYATLRQDARYGPFKMGFDAFAGTGYYVIGDTVFQKTYAPNHPGGVYADYGCSFETYTNELFLEQETLGELKSVAPGATETHIEDWRLFPLEGSLDPKDDGSIEAFVKGLK